jgi:LPS-assembly protein
MALGRALPFVAAMAAALIQASAAPLADPAPGEAAPTVPPPSAAIPPATALDIPPAARPVVPDPPPGAFPRPVVPDIPAAAASADPARRPAAAPPPFPAAVGAPAAPGAPALATGLPAPPPGAPISLVADRIAFDRDADTLTAEGNVEVHFDGRILRAARIVYRRAEDTIAATGPLSLVDPEIGVVFADEAAVTRDLTEGALAGARLLVAGVLQLAASEIRRSEGRYTILHRTIASSCEVCPGAAPTWAIRAERVVRDEETRLIHFRNARLEIFGLTVGWLPYFRIADPTVRRASGVLAPDFRLSDLYGLGVRVPIYQVLGPHADFTLTPFLTQRGGSLVEAEYRRRFLRGAIDLTGAVTLDDRLEGGGARGTLAATGHYDLGRGFRGEIDAAWASDDRFLAQFDYSDADRLTSTLRVTRVLPSERFSLGTVGFQSLRPEEDRTQIPLILPELRYRRLLDDPLAGGRIALEAEGVGLLREGGRDLVRLGGGGDWRRDWVAGPGLVVGASAGGRLDFWQVRDDPAGADGSALRATPFARAELRWPLVRDTIRATHVLEPIADIAWSAALGEEGPNEDGLLVEFDETNLFALDRFPGSDRIETGLRVNLGLGYSLFDRAGRSATATFGRVIRFDERDRFAAGTGLSGTVSDWVGAVEVALGPAFGAVNRIRFGDRLDVARNEFSLIYDTQNLGLAASWYYVSADADPLIGPQPETSEVQLAGRYRFLPNWQIRGDWRYDAALDSTIRAGAGLTYGNDCAEIDLNVTRRFVPLGEVPPTTSFGFAVRLVGLGAGGTGIWPRRACGG